MCGIAGLFSKSLDVSESLGSHLGDMLLQLSDRGPDSAGVAIYRDRAPSGSSKVSLFSPDPQQDWGAVQAALDDAFGAGEPEPRGSHAVIVVEAEAAEAQAWLHERYPELRVMSAGQAIEIFKEMGSPREFVETFDLAGISGSHALGHTRMATESRVTTEHSHPFSTGLDLCLVHNGSLSNHNRLRRQLRREGISFQTENDTEVAAGFLEWRLREAIACKPAVMAENDDWVAMASEYRAIAVLPGADAAEVWEPEPARVYSWERPRQPRGVAVGEASGGDRIG